MKGWRGRGGGRGAVPCRLPPLWLMDRTRIAPLLPIETSAAFVVINTQMLADYLSEYFGIHTSQMMCEIIYIYFSYMFLHLNEAVRSNARIEIVLGVIHNHLDLMSLCFYVGMVALQQSLAFGGLLLMWSYR